MNRLVYIAGASSRAQTTREYLESLDDTLSVAAYLVSPGMPDCGQTIRGIPVYSISEQSKLNTQKPVYIATRGVNQEKIEHELRSIGFQNIIPVTPDIDNSLRNRYVKRAFAEQNRKFIKINDLTADRCGQRLTDVDSEEMVACQKNYLESGKCTASIYVVSTSKGQDNVSYYSFLPEEHLIQAGTALTDERVFDAVYDNEGDNISEKNRQYCELTALYWIWKHAKEDYVGLVHYRRHFILPDDWLKRLTENDVDVLLPVPLYVAPTLEENFKMRHISAVWEVMLDKLRQIHPDDYKCISGYLKTSGLYSPCNMFVMKRQIMQEYCKWLFPVLNAVSNEIGQVDDAYQNRYPGFLSERLMTAYFVVKGKERKIVYSDKNFLR